jgi:hypothetical protein
LKRCDAGASKVSALLFIGDLFCLGLELGGALDPSKRLGAIKRSNLPVNLQGLKASFIFNLDSCFSVGRSDGA